MGNATVCRHAALLLAGGALLLVVDSGRAAAQCVGDCDGDGEVTVDELIRGVNIALGSQPVSACPAFANSEGEVTMAQLILGVNNALNGCPPVPSPTPTDTAGPTPTPTGSTEGNCVFIPGAAESHLELNVGALPNPVILNLVGSIDVACVVPEGGGNGECSCDVASIDPIGIPGVGTVCIDRSPQPCPSGVVACSGGGPLGVALRSDGNIGSCASNDACSGLCESFCAAAGTLPSASGCTGYCSLANDVACSNDAECLPDNGACNGPDPVGANFDICQCGCVDPAVGAPSRDGELQCNLGVVITVETNPPCDGGDVIIDLGSSCIAQTTATASTLITNANFGAGTVPASGVPASGTGAPIACSALASGSLSDLKIRGVVNFFGSALGDIATLFAADCQ